MSRRPLLIAYLLFSTLACWGQDTRGALLPDTLVALMDGTSAAADLSVGTLIWTWLPGEKPGPGKVTAIRRVHADSYVLIKAGKTELAATGSHRLLLADGTFTRIDTIQVGQKVAGWGPRGEIDLTVTDVRVYPASLIAYDLTIEGHRAFQAGGVLVGD
jgi:hypothetical protein